MHKITIPTTAAVSFIVLSASRLAEVSHRAEFASERSASIVPTIQIRHSLLSLFLIIELDVHIANHVIAKVLAYLNVFYSSEC